MKRIWLVLAVLLVAVLASGETLSATTQRVKVEDFDETTGQLFGYPNANPPLAQFVRTLETVHVNGPPINQFPNGPCRVLAVTWEFVVAITRETGETPVTRAIFDVLTQAMGVEQCSASILGDGASPPNIVSINPSP